MTISSPSGRAPLPLAACLYGLLTIGAYIWCYFSGPGPLVVDPVRATWLRTLVGILGGLALGVGVAGGSRLLVSRAGWARELYRWFAGVLGPLSWGEVLALALLSSIGEELFFRGAMQPALGLWLTTLIFGLAHFPPRLRLAPWTLSALAFGLAFGWLTLWSGSVAGAVVSHFTINLLNLRHATRAVARGSKNLPVPDRPPSMGPHEDHSQDHASADARRRDPGDGVPPGDGR